MKKILISILLVVCVFTFISCGNDEKSSSTENNDSQNTIYEYIEDNHVWKVSAVEYKEKIISLDDYPDLGSTYSSAYLTFGEGYFCYYDSLTIKGTYEKYDTVGEKQRYLFKGETVVNPFADTDEETEIEDKSKWIYIVTVLDENTIRFNDFDPMSGDEKGDSIPLIMASTEESDFINDNKYNNNQSNNSNESSADGSDSNDTHAQTDGEFNALTRAFDYLNYSAFSHRGLVEQLEYEGYTHSEAVYAADHCGADWKEQAMLKANEYLSNMTFSKTKLIEQLEYEGFTHEEAQYGADMAY